jgi:Ligand-gated ion channel
VYNITKPPASLARKAREFSGSNTSFDFCSYATSLGYLDACIGQYVITNQRSLRSDWILLGEEKLFLFVINEGMSSNDWHQFIHSVGTIFQPFTLQNWLFILFFVIPVMGCLMIVHERGKPGSTYPIEETLLYKLKDGGRDYMKKRKIPYWRTVVKSIYVSLLAVLQSSYEQSVVSVGAMLNLLGISFFILTIIAVYMANLAAILTQNPQITAVTDLNGALRNGYRFCTERQNVQFVTSLYHEITPSMFVVDPIAQGGDGLAGFACPTCLQRTRTFDMLDPYRAQHDDRYCHAAIARMEDLQVLQSTAKHCNKTAVGQPLRSIPLGFPVYEKVRPALSAFVSILRNEGLYDKAMIAYQPRIRCSEYLQNEGSALGVSQLSGIWVISFGFAALGLLYAFSEWAYRKIYKLNYTVEPIHKRDQKGVRMESFLKEPSWLSTRFDSSIKTSGNLLDNSTSTINDCSAPIKADKADKGSNRRRVSFSIDEMIRMKNNASSCSSSSNSDMRDVYYEGFSAKSQQDSSTNDSMVEQCVGNQTLNGSKHHDNYEDCTNDTNVVENGNMNVTNSTEDNQTDENMTGSSSQLSVEKQKDVDATDG